MNYLILALATWRISSLLANEVGPCVIFERLRNFVGVYYDSYSNRQGGTQLAQMLICVWCSSIWVGLILAAGYWLLGDVVVWLSLPLALSTIAISFEEWLQEAQ